jgi:hypothetical protein
MNEFDNPEGVIIACTQPKERMEVDNGQRWYEYRLRPVTEKETYELRQAGTISRFAAPGFVLENKHHATHNSMMFTEGWRVWTYGDTPDAAVEDVIGDTSFQEADSIHPIHSFHVQHHRKVRAANNELYEAQKAHKLASEEREDYRAYCNREFDNRTSGKPDDRVKQIKERLLKKFRPEMDVLIQTEQAAERRYAKAKDEAEKLNAIKPRYCP